MEAQTILLLCAAVLSRLLLLVSGQGETDIAPSKSGWKESRSYTDAIPVERVFVPVLLSFHRI